MAARISPSDPGEPVRPVKRRRLASLRYLNKRQAEEPAARQAIKESGYVR